MKKINHLPFHTGVWLTDFRMAECVSEGILKTADIHVQRIQMDSTANISRKEEEQRRSLKICPQCDFLRSFYLNCRAGIRVRDLNIGTVTIRCGVDDLLRVPIVRRRVLNLLRSLVIKRRVLDSLRSLVMKRGELNLLLLPPMPVR